MYSRMKKLKLNNITLSNLNDYELDSVKGGQTLHQFCACGCKYANKGGSSTNSNGNANKANKLCSPGMKSLDQMTLEEISNIDLRKYRW